MYWLQIWTFQDVALSFNKSLIELIEWKELKLNDYHYIHQELLEKQIYGNGLAYDRDIDNIENVGDVVMDVVM